MRNRPSIGKTGNGPQVSAASTSGVKAQFPDRAVQSQAVGLLLLDSSLRPVSCNYEAIRILCYPEVPEKIRRVNIFLKDNIQARLLDRRHSRFVTAFVSGKRCYRCRVFHLNHHLRRPSVPGVTELLLERSVWAGSFFLPRIAQRFNFSRREQQAVELLLQGLSSKEIADRMKISPNTVNTFLRLVMIKMGVSSRSGILGKIIVTSFDRGLIAHVIGNKRGSYRKSQADVGSRAGSSNTID